MAAPDDQTVDDVTSEDELMADEKESGANKEVSDDSPTANDKALNPNGVEPENHSATNQVALVGSSTTQTLPTSNRLGFLSLPPEIRLDIYRLLLISQFAVSTYWFGTYHPFPALLHTSRVIRREAFRVFYGENTFVIGFRHPMISLLNHRQIRDTIQFVNFAVVGSKVTSPNQTRRKFIHVIEAFGSPAIVRHTLVLGIQVDLVFINHLLEWLGRGLARFTNFRAVKLLFVLDDPEAELSYTSCRMQEILRPRLGPASAFGPPDELLFHPRQYLSSLPPKIDVDWMYYLDGIRLTWDQDPPVTGV
ncbi:hypothetical protein MMC29_007130 [Sticta canariensis]|nr:hypothetical protein [Sticta canariensis]